MTGTNVSGVRGSKGYATTNLWEDRINAKKFLNSPVALRVKDRHEKALMTALLRQIAKGNKVPAKLVNEVNEYFGYEAVPTDYIEDETSTPKQRSSTRKPAVSLTALLIANSCNFVKNMVLSDYTGITPLSYISKMFFV